jgi:peptide/nickel transport system substrate-binding protein
MSDGGPADTLDGNAGSSSCDWARQTALYDRLAEQAPDGSSVPALAESFEHNSDGTVWTVKLRPDVHWHNGKPFTADDVIYTIKRIGAPKSTLDGVSEVSIIDLPSIKKIDNLTLQLPLHQATADLASFFTIYFMSIIPEGTTSFHHPIGTGPFEFKSFTPGQSSLFTRNPNYWMEGKPYVDELYIESITNPTTRLNALLSGEVDAIESLTFSDAQQQKSSSTIKLLISTSDNLVPLTMACDTAPFNDPNVRKAMRLIVDRPALIETAQVGYGAIGNDLYGKGLVLYDTALPQRAQDLDQAKSLLKRSGHEGLTVTLNTSSVAAGMYESALAFAQQAKGAGVNVQLNNIPASNYFTTNYLKYVFGQTFWTAYPIPQFFVQALVSNAPFNETHWRSPSFDKLFYDAQADLNPSSRQDKFFALQNTLFQEGGYVIWGFQPIIDAVGAHVHPAPQNPAGYLGNYEFRDFWLD